ncbi:MAG TPA: c-type cytochrome [Solirubrobacteraceae bacterium]
MSRRGARLAVCALALALALGACEREQRRFSEVAPASGRPDGVRMSELQPGVPAPPSPDAAQPSARPRAPYQENAWAVSEGQRLYTWYNCAGCHAHGGGGMGPALMDDKWIYGSEPQNVYATIVEGRPNGMPSFGGKIPDAEVWQLVAYVRSLSGQNRKDVRSGRDDHMNVAPAPSSVTREPPTSASVPPSASAPK